MAGYIIDARSGGLVLGRTHEEGGISCIAESGGKFNVICRVEGGDFIVNGKANLKHQDRLQEIHEASKFLTTELTDYQLNDKSLIYNTFASQPKFLWITGSEFIMNKNAASAYIEELEEINFTENKFINFEAV